MPRLRDTRTGVVVDVDEQTGAALGAAYEPAEKSAPVAKAPAKKAAASKSSK